MIPPGKTKKPNEEKENRSDENEDEEDDGAVVVVALGKVRRVLEKPRTLKSTFRDCRAKITTTTLSCSKNETRS